MSNLPSGCNEPQSLDNYLEQLEGNIDQLTKERDAIRTALESLNLAYHRVLLENAALKAELEAMATMYVTQQDISFKLQADLKAWADLK